MTDQPIELVEYSPSWATLFVQERDLLLHSLAPWLQGVPEHVGSTAVPGLAAKPVIDIMAPVESLDVSRPAIEVAARLGYVHHPYLADQMHWFCKPNPQNRTHHLHLVPVGSQRWRDQLEFRDALRASPELRAQYQALKLALARQHRADREAYTSAKAPFIGHVLQRFRRGAA